MRKDPTEFRKRFAAWKNGKQPYEAGLPKYEDGNKPTMVGEYNVYPSAIGASELNVTTPEVVVTGTDRRPLYQRYDAPNSTYDPDAIRMFSDWAPITGNIGIAKDIYDAVENKNYIDAATLASLSLAPVTFGKILKNPLRKIGKKIFESYNSLPMDERAFAQMAVPAAIGAIPGMYTAITADDGLQTLGGLGAMVAGSAVGALGGKGFINKIEPKILKKYYGINRGGILPKLSENSYTEDVLFSQPEWTLEERRKAAMSNIRHRFNKLQSGDSYALISDGALSTDSSPLYFMQLARHHDVGTVNTVKDQLGNITMSRLNRYGKYHNIDDINNAIDVLRNKTGISLPNAKQVGKQIYIPKVYITKK